MSSIKVMSRELANRIAAGEVVERPGSVVKELVENSLDAGADRIKVTIEKAGVRLIQVTDNGCGMDDEDALLAFEEHGTSKLTDDSDLQSIGTLGFRGEAIPSIASVSRFTLKTRRRDAASGIKVTVDAGILQSSVPDGGAAGTTIEVRDLFYNVPARKKFLKTPATEEHHIEEMMINLALGHYEQSFELRIDRRVSFSSAGSATPELRIRELFGRSFANNLLPVEHRENNITVTGFIASAGFTRSGRREQRIFVNRRAIESQAIYRGIRDGYGTLSQESGRYPPAVLYIDMPPEEVDVNVHPAKKEVRFKSEYIVSRAVAAAVSEALQQMRNPGNIPVTNGSSLPLSGKLPLSMVLDASEVSYTPEKIKQPELLNISEEPVKNITAQLLESEDNEEIAPVSCTPEKETVPEEKVSFSPLVKEVKPAAFSGNWPERIIGVIDRTYLLGECSDGLVLIDQHAAHERIMFEKILAEAEKASAARQQLLIAETVELPRAMVKLLMGNAELFDRLGFEIESAGGCTVLVNSVPLTPCGHKEIGKWLYDMLNELLENSPASGAVISPEFAARAACRAAIKAHDELSLKEMELLLEQLKKCRQGTLCPHGRPTLVAINFNEIEKRFGRR